MSTKTKVTETDAEQVLAAIRQTFKAYVDETLDVGPRLVPDFDGREWTILWEDGAPYEWPYLLSGGLDEEMASLAEEFNFEIQPLPPTVFPKGVFVEPVNHLSVAIYPA